MPHVVRAGVVMKTMAVVVEAAAAQAKRGHGGYENEFDGILLHNFFRLKCVDSYQARRASGRFSDLPGLFCATGLELAAGLFWATGF